MAEQQKQYPEPEFEGTPEEFIETLQKRIQNSIPIQSLPLVKIIKFHEKGTKPEIKIENLAEFICEKTVTDIKQAMVNSVLYVDIHNAPIQALTDVITTMAQGARPLAKVGIIDVLSVNIDECPEGSLNEPLELRKTRISNAFTEILGNATVEAKDKKNTLGEDEMAKERTPKERSDILENDVREIKENLKAFQNRFNDHAANIESRVGNVDGKIGKVENDVSIIKREHGQKLDELSSGINKLLKHAGLEN